LQQPGRGVGKRAGGLIIGRCFFVAGGLGFVGARRAGWCWYEHPLFWCRWCDERYPLFWRRGKRSWFWGRGRSFQDLGDLDVCVCDVGAVGRGRDGVGRFVLDECKHVVGGLA
jgi:hypothetical protein